MSWINLPFCFFYAPVPLLSLWLSFLPSFSLWFPLVPLNLSRSPGGQWRGCVQRLLLLCSFHPQHKSARDAHRDHRCLQHAHAHPQAVKAPLEYFHSKYATADAKQHPLALLEAMLRTLSTRGRQDAQKYIQATSPFSTAGKKKKVSIEHNGQRRNPLDF